MENFNKIAIIIRGAMGSGKSSFATYLKSLNKDAVICTADDYFTDNFGNYNFNPKELPLAHNSCREKYVKAMADGVPLVVCANTNAKEGDFSFYLAKAREWGYTAFSIVIENRHGNRNEHNVSEEKVASCAENIKNSLKLF